MIKNILLPLLAVAIGLGFGERRVSAQESRPWAEIGRFQLAALPDGRVLVLDTATGHCWSRTLGGEWRDEGNPTQTNEEELAGTPQETPDLDLPSETVEMLVIQREQRAIPGSDGAVRLRLGDITEGQAFLSLITSDGDILLERASVKQGDKVEFAVGKKRFVLEVHELRNILVGDDFAKITIAEAMDESPGDPRPPRQEP